MKFSFLSLFILLFSGSLNAQSQRYTILDINQNVIEAVSVLNKTTNQHTFSNALGEFVLEDVTIGDSLQLYHVSYSSDIIIVENIKSPQNIVMNPKSFNIEGVVISPRLDALNLIAKIDIKTKPVNSSQDVLRKVSGLFIGQHAGGGKAEQIFLRGFDIDHGTDITITVDGLPVNMVSHTHGQGYADLHFVIPETIDNIEFGKGPYYSNQGNFNTAGYVNFKTRETLDNNAVKLELGQFNTQRILGAYNVVKNRKHNAYIASEFLMSDGPFESPQNFSRFNLFGKYTGTISDTDKIGITLSRFSSTWNASGQIPERVVQSGAISRFGAIDDTEGGTTNRTNILLNHLKFFNNNSSLRSSVYFNQYDLELFSNFTFFLEDPINGDQIRQKENRNIYGFNSEYRSSYLLGTWDGTWQAGVSLRHDMIDDNELSRTLNRSDILERIQFGDVNEMNLSVYASTTLDIQKWRFIPAIRIDYFNFQYSDALFAPALLQSQNSTIISPKFNILYNPSSNLQIYLKTGKGFHSNDTRVIVAGQVEETIPAAYGTDLGFIWKPTSKMFVNLAYWYLFLEQEFVYVGDAGIVEPSGETRRQGVDISYRYQPLSWLYWNMDANYAYARSIYEAEGQDFIPLAPNLTLATGINVSDKSGIYGGLNLRFIDDRPANEDNTIVAEGYTITDLNMGYKWNKINLGFQIQNLFDADWNETQFATESRLQNETESVEEIHFTPGAPFFIKGIVEYNF